MGALNRRCRWDYESPTPAQSTRRRCGCTGAVAPALGWIGDDEGAGGRPAWSRGERKVRRGRGALQRKATIGGAVALAEQVAEAERDERGSAGGKRQSSSRRAFVVIRFDLSLDPDRASGIEADRYVVAAVTPSPQQRRHHTHAEEGSVSHTICHACRSHRR
jgi:hypothetical protein